MADNLLDKASILLTPTAYNDGSMLSIKPENGDGDFNFSRSSAATRVNAQGLVENVQILSTELVTNGDFATDSDWIKGNGTTISGGQANLDGSLSGSFQDPLRQSSVFTVGKTYKVEYTISNYVSGAVTVFGNGATEVSSNGTYTQYINATITTLSFQNRAVPITCSIDNVSVKELVDDTNIPRIDYTDGCGNWLLEPQSTNLITNSELLNTYFTNKIDTTITDNYGTSPSGETNSSRIQFVDDTSFCYTVISVSTDHTSSVFVKGVSGETVRFGIGGNVTTGDLFTFNGLWQRIDFTASSAIQIFFSSYGGATTRDFEAFGLQLEALSYATSYIPTSGATNTRLQDIANNSGNSSLINSTEGVLYAEMAALADDTTNNRISLSYNNQNYVRIVINNLQINFSVFNNGAYQVNMNYTVSNITDFNKIAIKYKENDFALWINGTEVLTDTSGLTSFASPLDHINFSNANGNNQFFYGKTKALAVYKEALTDAELQSLTTI